MREDPFLGHFHARGPDDCVQYGFADPVDCPAVVIMATDKSDPTSTCWSLVSPHQGLGLVQALYPVLVPHVDIAVHVLAGRHSGEEVEDLVPFLDEAHVVIPLIETGYLFRNSVSDLVTLDDFQVGNPVRID